MIFIIKYDVSPGLYISPDRLSEQHCSSIIQRDAIQVDETSHYRTNDRNRSSKKIQTAMVADKRGLKGQLETICLSTVELALPKLVIVPTLSTVQIAI